MINRLKKIKDGKQANTCDELSVDSNEKYSVTRYCSLPSKLQKPSLGVNDKVASFFESLSVCPCESFKCMSLEI